MSQAPSPGSPLGLSHRSKTMGVLPCAAFHQLLTCCIGHVFLSCFLGMLFTAGFIWTEGFPAVTHSRSFIFMGPRKTMQTRRYTAILGISSETQGSCIASQVELFLDMFWETWKNIQMMVQMVVNTEFWGTADFYYSDCQDLSRKAQGWAVCVPLFYASTYPSVKFYVNNGKVTEHESHLNPTPQIMKLIPKKNDFSKVTERNHGLFGHLSIHPSIQFSIFFIHTSIYQLTHPFIHLFIWPHLPIHPPIIPLIPLSTVPGLV